MKIWQDFGLLQEYYVQHLSYRYWPTRSYNLCPSVELIRRRPIRFVVYIFAARILNIALQAILRGTKCYTEQYTPASFPMPFIPVMNSSASHVQCCLVKIKTATRVLNKTKPDRIETNHFQYPPLKNVICIYIELSLSIIYNQFVYCLYPSQHTFPEFYFRD